MATQGSGRSSSGSQDPTRARRATVQDHARRGARPHGGIAVSRRAGPTGPARDWWRLATPALAALVTLAVLLVVAPAPTAARVVGVETAIEIAQAEAQRLGYDVTTLSADADILNTAWYRHLTRPVNGVSHMPPAELMGRRFWAVYLGPGRLRLSTDPTRAVFVFVDAHTGEVITVLPA